MQAIYISGISGSIPTSLAEDRLSVKVDRCALLMRRHSSFGPVCARPTVETQPLQLLPDDAVGASAPFLQPRRPRRLITCAAVFCAALE